MFEGSVLDGVGVFDPGFVPGLSLWANSKIGKFENFKIGAEVKG